MKKIRKREKITNKKQEWKIVNKRRNQNFLLFKSWEAGIILKGIEVKKILTGQFDFKNSYVTYDKKNEVYLTNLQIENKEEKQKTQKHKLLLHKSEIKDLIKQKKEKKYTIIPTQIYLRNKKIKVLIALARGLKKYDKKQKERKKTFQI